MPRVSIFPGVSALLLILILLSPLFTGCAPEPTPDRPHLAAGTETLLLAIQKRTPAAAARFRLYHQVLPQPGTTSTTPDAWIPSEMFRGNLVAVLPLPGVAMPRLPEADAPPSSDSSEQKEPDKPGEAFLFVFENGSVHVARPPFTSMEMLHPPTQQSLLAATILPESGYLLAVTQTRSHALQLLRLDLLADTNPDADTNDTDEEAPASDTPADPAPDHHADPDSDIDDVVAGLSVAASTDEDSDTAQASAPPHGGWEPYAPPLPSLARAVHVALLWHKDAPHLFWRNRPADSIEPGLWAYRLGDDGEWHALPPMQGPPRRTAFTVVSTLQHLLFLEAEPVAMGTSHLAAQRLEGSRWRNAGRIPLERPFSAGAIRGIACAPWANGLSLVYTDAERVGYLTSGTPQGTGWKEHAHLSDASGSGLGSWVFVFLSVLFLSLYVWMRTTLRKRIRDLPRKEATAVRMIYSGGIATPLERAFALLIDIILVSPFPYLVFQHSGMTEMQILDASYSLYFLLLLGGLSAYSMVAEGVYGQTIGKRLLRIRVRNAAGGRLLPSQAVIRNLARFLDFYPVPFGSIVIPYLVALVSVSFTKRRQRVGDLLAGTVVRRHVPIQKRAFVLASGSPRRRALFEALGYAHRVVVPDVAETVRVGVPPRDVAVELAQKKADAAVTEADPGEIVVAADTVVVLGDEILGKPESPEEAVAMLTRLSGRTHRVMTGVAVIDTATRQAFSDCEITEVTMRVLSEAEIRRYVETGEPADKAGAYGIQGLGGMLVEMARGSYSNVVGLPMELLHNMLDQLDG